MFRKLFANEKTEPQNNNNETEKILASKYSIATDYIGILDIVENTTEAEIADLIYQINCAALGGAICEIYDTMRSYEMISTSRKNISRWVAPRLTDNYKPVINTSASTKKYFADGELKKKIDERVERVSQEIKRQRTEKKKDIPYINKEKKSFIDPEPNIEQIQLNPTDNPPSECGVYVIKDGTGNLYKIGCSNNIRTRFSSIKSHNPNARIEVALLTNDQYYLEKDLHERYRNKRIQGEWFSLEKSDLIEIVNYARKNNGAKIIELGDNT